MKNLLLCLFIALTSSGCVASDEKALNCQAGAVMILQAMEGAAQGVSLSTIMNEIYVYDASPAVKDIMVAAVNIGYTAYSRGVSQTATYNLYMKTCMGSHK